RPPGRVAECCDGKAENKKPRAEARGLRSETGMQRSGALEFGHPLGEDPKGLVELDVLIDALDRPRGDAAAATRFLIDADAADTALDHVFLNAVEGHPEIVG